MGNIYLRTGHFDQAAAAYQQIIQQDPEHVASAALGQVYLNQQRTDEAIAMLNRALDSTKTGSVPTKPWPKPTSGWGRSPKVKNTNAWPTP